MKKTLASAFEHFVPSAEELWQRGGAQVKKVEIEPDNRQEVPFFDLEIVEQKQLKVSQLEIQNNRRLQAIGREVLEQVTLSDGIERLVRVIELDDDERFEDSFTVTDGTAWTTTIGGYAADRARQISKQNRVNVIQIGAEHSGSKIPFGFDGLRVAQTVLQARTISLAKTAQSEQLIISQLAKDYNLASSQYAIGDSRAGMKTPGQFPYAALYGNQIIYMDINAPCVHEKLETTDIPRLARWLGVEAINGSRVILGLASAGRLAELAGVVSPNPNATISSLLGTAPALASGDAGQMVSWVPRSTYGRITCYENDCMSQADKWLELWQHHSNIYKKTIPGKSHAHILESKAREAQIGRIGRFSEELAFTGGRLEEVDWRNIDQRPRMPTFDIGDVA